MFTCPFCSAVTALPDDWAYPGFTCSVCHRPVELAPQLGVEPVAGESALRPQLKVRGWGCLPWIVFLLITAMLIAITAYLVTVDDEWLLWLGIPALAILLFLGLWSLVRRNWGEPRGARS